MGFPDAEETRRETNFRTGAGPHETFHPHGWLVASYDANGFANERRWFQFFGAAADYAAQLSMKLEG